MEWPTHPRELGLVTTAEAIRTVTEGGLGMTPRTVEWAVTSGKWQRLHRGVLVTHPGPIDWMTRAAAALLAFGEDSALCGPSAGVVHGLLLTPTGRDVARAPIHVVVPRHRRPRPQRGTVLLHSDVAKITDLWPRRTAYESTVLDLVAGADPDQVAHLLALALHDRRTTASRLRAELDGRTRYPQRDLVRDMLADVGQGCESPLEVRFVRDVLRPHRLPRGLAQWPAAALGEAGDKRRFDRAMPEFRLVVELDGDLYHRGASRANDRRKSNTAARQDWLLLRFGWADCTTGACAAAAELADTLTTRGWHGRLRFCGPRCQAQRRQASAS